MSKTAGSKWFDLPAFPASSSNTPSGRKKGGKTTYSSHGPTAEEMTREIQAIRLRNAMDPKRFYRGGNGANQKGMPAFAQMGRIISSNLEPSSTMNRSERGRTVIDELVKDAQNAAYTKRKFGEVSMNRSRNRSFRLCFFLFFLQKFFLFPISFSNNHELTLVEAVISASTRVEIQERDNAGDGPFSPLDVSIASFLISCVRFDPIFRK